MPVVVAPAAPGWAEASSAGPATLLVQRRGAGSVSLVLAAAEPPAGVPTLAESFVHVLGDEHPSFYTDKIGASSLKLWVQALGAKPVELLVSEGL